MKTKYNLTIYGNNSVFAHNRYVELVDLPTWEVDTHGYLHVFVGDQPVATAVPGSFSTVTVEPIRVEFEEV